MCNIERKELHRILNDINYVGEREQKNMLVFECIVEECLREKPDMFHIYYDFVIQGLSREAIIKKYSCSLRKVSHNVAKIREFMTKLIEDTEMTVGYEVGKYINPKLYILMQNKGKINKDELDFLGFTPKARQDLLMFGIVSTEQFKNFILSTGPSWFLRFSALTESEALEVESKLEIKHPMFNITDDIAIAALRSIKYKDTIDDRQVNAVRLILQSKYMVQPILTDCYIHYIMGCDYMSQNPSMSISQKSRIKSSISNLNHFLKNSRNMRAIKEGIDAITPVTDYYLIRLADKCDFKVIVEKKTYDDNTVLEDTNLSDGIIDLLKCEGLHTTDEVRFYIKIHGEKWYESIKNLGLFNATEVEYWLNV